jgi:hypothetical protein
LAYLLFLLLRLTAFFGQRRGSILFVYTHFCLCWLLHRWSRAGRVVHISFRGLEVTTLSRTPTSMCEVLVIVTLLLAWQLSDFLEFTHSLLISEVSWCRVLYAAGTRGAPLLSLSLLPNTSAYHRSQGNSPRINFIDRSTWADPTTIPTSWLSAHARKFLHHSCTGAWIDHRYHQDSTLCNILSPA